MAVDPLARDPVALVAASDVLPCVAKLGTAEDLHHRAAGLVRPHWAASGLGASDMEGRRAKQEKMQGRSSSTSGLEVSAGRPGKTS